MGPEKTAHVVYVFQLQVQSARLDEAQRGRSAAEQSVAASNSELQHLQNHLAKIQLQHRAAQAEVEKLQSQAQTQAADLAILQRVHEIVKGELDDAKSSKSPRCDHFPSSRHNSPGDTNNLASLT